MTDNSDIIGIITGGMWGTPAVSEQPMIHLVRWRVIEIQGGERHYVGYNIEDREGRVSSSIQQFDATTSIGVTSSGRVYELIGDPEYDPDGEYVWRSWVRANKVETERDVSDEILEIIRKAARFAFEK